jgi:hypothetical protein
MRAEDWLREHSESLTPIPGPPDGAARIVARTQARVFQHRMLRTATGGVEIALVAVAVIAVVSVLGRGTNVPAASASASPTATAETAAIQWINARGAKFNPAPADASPCTRTDLQFEPTHQGAYHGLATQEVIVTNVSSTACKLVGPPDMIASANSLSKAIDAGNFARDRIVIEPRSEVVMTLGAPAGCTSKDDEIADTVSLSIANGSPAELRGVYLPLACGDPAVVSFSQEGSPPSTDPRSSLVATWTGPGTAARGSTISYVIRLTNPTGADIALDPCPSYTQHANGDDVSETLLLNCADAQVIRAGGFEEFAMELTLPSGEGSPEIKVGWHLEVANGTTTGSVIAFK